MIKLSYVVALLCAVVPTFALADAATHEITMRLDTLDKTDCGGGSCVPACMIKATLKVTERGPANSVPINVYLWYRNKNVENEERAISLSFDGLKKGEISEITDHVPGHQCREVKIDRVTVECTGEDRCPGFYYVQIPETPTFGLPAQKVEGK
ncbi:hypothetical protein [Rhizobium paknamense]|uniref:Uncharacterized protein n=1 Tax=Rhizobium paknamense TaxID=1206817 RepID=A0ABU0IJ50_9HYPH|nr:hypothetical protein [Rhizobium paknamense]MDQ0458280.1 hypothetical protein [Rhizobium paknamense]